jgi:8-oxo-dGTP diphosphatase
MNQLRDELQQLLKAMTPFDEEEQKHITYAQNWLKTGAPLFRTIKPATPDPHLVVYFLLVDPVANRILLVDHKKSGLWLPAGGHVEPDEHPKQTVKRELLEELGVDAQFLSENPFMLTVTKTVGQTAGHTDVTFWYVLKGTISNDYKFDLAEFHQIQWFLPADIPYHRTDPHLDRCIQKLFSERHLEI